MLSQWSSVIMYILIYEVLILIVNTFIVFIIPNVYLIIEIITLTMINDYYITLCAYDRVFSTDLKPIPQQ